MVEAGGGEAGAVGQEEIEAAVVIEVEEATPPDVIHLTILDAAGCRYSRWGCCGSVECFANLLPSC
jgi:hypothetical protein